MSGARICVVGDALIDELRWPGRTEVFVGGAGLNVAVGLTRLKAGAAIVAMVGEDRAGDEIRAYLASFDVSLWPTVVPVSSRAVSDRTAGEPRYVFNDSALNRRIAFDAAQRTALDAAPLVVVSCFPLDDTEQVRLLTDAVRDPGSRLILDPNPRDHLISDREAFRSGFEKLAARSLLVKIGDEDSMLLYGEPLEVVAPRILALGPAAVLATAGTGGASLLLRSGAVVHRPIRSLADPVVDTMGAGDATLATVTATLARNGMPSTEEATGRLLEEAMAVAAATCRMPGALLRLPGVAAPATKGGGHSTASPR
ncbi:MAG: PfkB family carbohydrate kinase [Leifsonia sp.]